MTLPVVGSIAAHSVDSIRQALIEAGTQDHEVDPMSDHLVHQVLSVEGLSSEQVLALRALAAPAGVFAAYAGRATDEDFAVLLGGTMDAYTRLIQATASTSLELLGSKLGETLEYLPTTDRRQ